jgi:eukaryotic-like serine/threonine-protein kinase
MFASTTDCPPETAFTDLFAGQLEGADVARLGRHIEACDACREVFDALSVAATNAKIAREAIGDAVTRPSAAPGSVGRTLDRRYSLLRLLGEGGMGEVYEAAHTGTGRRVAVKLIRARLGARGDEAERRFRREAKAAGALHSPHIVEVLDAGEDAETGDPYLVMELLHGEDLQHLVDRLGPLPPDVALRIAAQALAGLVRAHEAGIVHRDIKPANLFLVRGEGGEVTVKVLDFGVAKVENGALQAALTSGLTRTEGLLGSPLYMSHEQMQNSKGVDFRTDLWSLGSVLYCALAGRAPYRHVENLFELLPAVRSGQAPPLRDLAPWVPAPVAQAVARALAVAPEDRYPSAAAMLEALRALTPEGPALREEMLVGVSPEVRASAAVPAAGAPSSAVRRVALPAALVLCVAAAAGPFLRSTFAPSEVATATSARSGSAPEVGAAPSPPSLPRSAEQGAVPPRVESTAPTSAPSALPPVGARVPASPPRSSSGPASGGRAPPDAGSAAPDTKRKPPPPATVFE